MKKTLVAVIAMVLVVAMGLVACAPAAPTPSASPSDSAPADSPSVSPSESTPAEPSDSAPADDGKVYIPVLAKGFQHQFWKTVASGAEKAAEDLGVEIYFVGPPSESDIAAQVEQMKGEMAKNPDAIVLAALSTESLLDQLNEAKNAGIPVVGFDSGVPDAPEGSIVANASTNNENAGALAAEEMFKIEDLVAKLSAATEDKPVVVGVYSQDAVSGSIIGRTKGFIDKFVELAGALEGMEGAIAVEGNDKYNAPAANGKAKIVCKVFVPPTSNDADIAAIAPQVLNTENLAALFCSNEGSVKGLLTGTNEGADLDKENGKYKDLIVIGFDAGERQKAAVRNQYFWGAITQDPYNIGYKGVELAAKAAKGEAVSDVDTGAKFYNFENIDSEDIAPLVYD